MDNYHMDEFFDETTTTLTRSQRKRLRRTKKTPTSAANPIVKNNLEPVTVSPKGKKQKLAFQAYLEGKNLLLHGVAGTGKTFIAIALALVSLYDENQYIKKIVIVRSAVPSRDIGFLPGSAKEKMAAYETPYEGILSELFKRSDAYSLLKTKKVIEFMPSSFLRGSTFNDTIVIIDEIQNFTGSELDTVITRVGKNARLILCGDHRQDDLSGKKGEQSGIVDMMKILSSMSSMATVEFGIEDIQRGDFLREYIIQRIKLGYDKPLVR